MFLLQYRSSSRWKGLWEREICPSFIIQNHSVFSELCAAYCTPLVSKKSKSLDKLERECYIERRISHLQNEKDLLDVYRLWRFINSRKPDVNITRAKSLFAIDFEHLSLSLFSQPSDHSTTPSTWYSFIQYNIKIVSIRRVNN